MSYSVVDESWCLRLSEKFPEQVNPLRIVMFLQQIRNLVKLDQIFNCVKMLRSQASQTTTPCDQTSIFTKQRKKILEWILIKLSPYMFTN